MKMEAADSCKTLVLIYETQQHHVSEDCNLDIHRCQNLKSEEIFKSQSVVGYPNRFLPGPSR
jgi:hypothetical protein